MPIKVLELHHHGIRIGTTPAEVESGRRFYTDVLGLEADTERPVLPGVPGFWMFVGNDKHTASIHLMGAAGVSPLARSAKEDPTLPHVALAVEDIQQAKRELEHQGIWFWQIQGLVGVNSDQLFVEDPFGNIIELHQIGTCRCNKATMQQRWHPKETAPMGDDTVELKERIAKLSDDELIEMVTVAAGDYRQEALDYAKAELDWRRVDWSKVQSEPIKAPVDSEPVESAVTETGAVCASCGGQLRAGTLVAEKELTIIFSDNREERFVKVMACVQCGQLSLIADYDTELE